MKKQTVFLLPLGCPKNLTDSEEMLYSLSKIYGITEKPDNADIIVINTCAFIREASEEAIDAILEASRYKKIGSCKKLIVTGCLPQRYKKNLIKLLPEVDLFMGPAEIPNLNKYILNDERGLKASAPPYIPKGITKRKILSSKYSAYLKIADGCSKACSYCMIPKIRGKAKSRSTQGISNEAKDILAKGFKEITLISQDTTAFGKDLKSKNDIIKLLRKLSKLNLKNKWIRILYSQPTPLLIELGDFVSSTSGFAPYIDIPIQHSSKKVLKLMNRTVSTEKIVRKLRKIPGLYLRTTVMVGFPGESEKDFKDLLNFIKEIEFDHLGVFIYSPEEGTKAFSLKGKPRLSTAQKRWETIMEAQAEISHKKLKSLIGNKIPVLIEEKIGTGKFVGRHIGQAPEIDGVTFVNGNAKIGTIVNAKITGSRNDYDLIAKL